MPKSREEGRATGRNRCAQAARHRNRSRDVEFTVPDVHWNPDGLERKSPRTRAEGKLGCESSEPGAESLPFRGHVRPANALKNAAVALGDIACHGVVDAFRSHHAQQRNGVRSQRQTTVECTSPQGHAVANAW